MSIFGKSQSVTTDVTAPVFEGYGAEVNGDILAITESYEDQLAVVQALHAIDMEEIATRGEVKTLTESAIATRVEEFEVVTESMVKNAWEKIKTFFKNLWGKIQGFFKSVVLVFDKLFKSDSEFAKKYESDLKKLSLGGFEYKMHTYTNLENVEFDKKSVTAAFDEMRDAALKAATSPESINQLETMVRDYKEDREELINGLRGDHAGGGSLTAEQYARKLYAKYRSGAEGADEAKEQRVEIGKIIEVLKDTKAKKNAEALAKKTDDEFSRIIKAVNDLENKFANAKAKDGNVSVKQGDNTHTVPSDRSSKVIEGLRVTGSIFSAMKDVQLQDFRAWREAYTERARVYKSACLAAFRHKESK